MLDTRLRSSICTHNDDIGCSFWLKFNGDTVLGFWWARFKIVKFVSFDARPDHFTLVDVHSFCDGGVEQFVCSCERRVR